MPKTASLNIRIDPTIKLKAEHLYSDFGITLSDAVNMFIYKSIQCNGLPFELRKENPAITAMRNLSNAAQENKTSKMTLEEINKEIDIIRNNKYPKGDL